MGQDFQYDVFLSHSSKDKAVVRPLAERLRDAGLRLWFAGWVLKPGDSIPGKIEAVRERQNGVNAKGVPGEFAPRSLIDRPR
jgi:hypothetical protein